MKTSKFFVNAFLCFTLIGSFTSCSDDDGDDLPDVVEEEEAITSLVLTYTNQDDATDTVILTWVDDNEDLIIDAGEMERTSDDYLRTDGVYLGVETAWTAGSTAGTGTITAQLYHEAPSVDDTDGFGSTTGTDTDIDITFSVTITE